LCRTVFESTGPVGDNDLDDEAVLERARVAVRDLNSLLT
jgi:hypothetical protein